MRILTIIGLLVFLICPAQATVNVIFSSTGPANLQNDFIASATAQYFSSVTKNYLFAGTDRLMIFGKNPNYTPPAISTNILTLDGITQRLEVISTYTYVYGWADGMEYGRGVDLGRISNYIVNCSSAPYFKTSTTTWNENVCTMALNAAFMDIYNMKFSTPTVVPGH